MSIQMTETPAKMEESSGRATEEGSFFRTDINAIDVVCTEQTNKVNIQYGQSR